MWPVFVEPATNRQVATLEIEASLAGYRRLLKWAGTFSERRWAVENTRGLGRHLAQWLLARGEVVEDVPSTATARCGNCPAADGARMM
jgi:transposase